MFKKIVCATDFTEAAEVATRYAASIARTMDASLDLVHAWHFATELPNELASLRHEVVASSRDTDRAKLDSIVRELAAHGVKASAALVEGSPDRAVPDYAAARGAELLVVGTNAFTGLSRAFLGSVAERILRTSSVPVLVVPKNVSVAPDAVFAPKEILVPTDLSPASSDALRLAVALGKRCIARVTTLHAWEVPPYFFEGGQVIAETEQRIPDHVRAWMEETFGDVEPNVESIVQRGDPNEVIADVCRHRAPELVVMATAGRVGLEHFMLGSITERAVRTLGRPVLTMRRAPEGHAVVVPEAMPA